MKSILDRLINIFNLKEVVGKSIFLYSIAISYRRIFWRSTKTIIEQRKNISLFDYKALSAPLSAYPFYYILENNYYGSGRVLSRVFNIDKYTRIEHGLFLGNYVPKHNYFKTIKHIVTFSDYRRYCNFATGKNIICAGPYIQYAQSILTDEQSKLIKGKLGKILLVFPSHSIDALHAKFDIKDFIDFILVKKHQYNFNTVIVCLYWKDVELGMDKSYIDHGFMVVTAGHIYDYYFLDRLKSIIEISDYTISNEVGTHIGYCVSMNKPHYIYMSKIQYVPDIHAADSEKMVNIRNAYKQEISSVQKQEIINKFSHWHHQVTDDQLRCVEYYWGVVGNNRV